MNLGVRDDYARATCIFNREACAAVFASNAADSTAQVVAMQGLDIFDLERVDEQVIET